MELYWLFGQKEGMIFVYFYELTEQNYYDSMSLIKYDNGGNI